MFLLFPAVNFLKYVFSLLIATWVCLFLLHQQNFSWWVCWSGTSQNAIWPKTDLWAPRAQTVTPPPPPPDLQLEGRPLQMYTDCAGSKRHSCECGLDRPLTSSVIGRALTSIPRRSPLAVHPERLWLGSPAKWEELFLPPGMRLWAMNILSEIKWSCWGQEKPLRDKFLISRFLFSLPEGHCSQGRGKGKPSGISTLASSHLEPCLPTIVEGPWNTPIDPHHPHWFLGRDEGTSVTSVILSHPYSSHKTSHLCPQYWWFCPQLFLYS